MAAPAEPQSELTSWKGIADYLGVNVRTAQRWELERGLPVRRFPGERGRVSADPRELVAWKAATLEKPDWWTSVPFLRRYALGLTAVVLVLLLGALAAYLVANRRGPPALYRVQGRTVIISDGQGRELWRKTFEQTPIPPGEQREMAWFGDLDGDGATEVLLGYAPEPGSALICYSERGTQKWRFVPGRSVSTPAETFTPTYHLRNFAVAPIGSGGANAVVVNSRHYAYFPSQVAVLSARGELLGEYWHSGGFYCVAVADVDHDGVQEIVLGGVSQGHKQATLVILDPRRLGGASVEDEAPRYQIQGFPPAREKARLLFPRSCINRKFEPYGQMFHLLAAPDSLTAHVHQRAVSSANHTIAYELTPHLELKQLIVPDTFRALHQELEASGQLDHKLSEREEAELRKIRYLVGGPGR